MLESPTTQTVYGPTAGATTQTGVSVETLITTVLQSTVTTTSYVDAFTGSAFTSTVPAQESIPAIVVYGMLDSVTYYTVYGPIAGATTQTGASVETVITTSPFTTVTTTVFEDPASGSMPPFTTTFGAVPSNPTGTIVIGVVESYVYTTTYGNFPSGTSTLAAPSGTTLGTILVSQPFTTTSSTTYVDYFTGNGPFTSTFPVQGATPATILYGIPDAVYTSTAFGPTARASTVSGVSAETLITTVQQSTVSSTTYVDYFTGNGPFTSTIPAQGPIPATVLVGVVDIATTSTTYGPTAGASTVSGVSAETLITTVQQSTTSTTTYVDYFTGNGPFTSTYPAHGSFPGTLVYGVVDQITTITFYGPTAGAFTVSGVSAETLITTVAQSTVTTTVYGPATGISYQPPQGATPGTLYTTAVEPTTTSTSFLDTTGHAYTSTFTPPASSEPVTVVVGYSQSYTSSMVFDAPQSGTSTIYPAGTVPGTIIYSKDYFTVSTTQWEDPATGGTPFTSTLPASPQNPTGTLIYGSLESCVSSTVYDAPQTGTSIVPPSNSIPGTYIYSEPYTTTFTTSFEDPLTGPTSAFTTTYSASPDSLVATVEIRYVQSYITSSEYGGPQAGTSTIHPVDTIAGNIIVSEPFYTTTVTSYEDPLAGAVSAYTSIIPAVPSNPTGTILVRY